jgi:hypothetical protein
MNVQLVASLRRMSLPDMPVEARTAACAFFTIAAISRARSGAHR